MRLFLFGFLVSSAFATCPVHFASYWPHNACLTLDVDAVDGSLCEALAGNVVFRQLDPLGVSSGMTASVFDAAAASPQCPQGITRTFDVVCAPEAETPAQKALETDGCQQRLVFTSRFACPLPTSPSSCAPVPIPTPTASQLAYQLREIVALTHFNMATFFGDGDPGCNSGNWAQSSQPGAFNPTQLNVSNWVESYLALGAKGALLTAKHGCGFLLWPTKTTLPNGTVYPYSVGGPGAIRVDVIQEFRAACEAAGLGIGFYYSLHDNYFLNVPMGGNVSPNPPLPGMASVTQEEFEAIAVAQLTELWSSYGSFVEIWFDGGYQHDIQQNLTNLLADKQPGAAVFNGFGVSNSSLKWIGTESGMPSYPVWSTGCMNAGDPNSLVYCPATSDTTLQDGDHWFYTPGDGIRDLATLIQVYHDTVGQNSVLELDFAIDRTGRVDPTHAAAYAQFGDWIRSCYGAAVANTSSSGSTSIVLQVPASTPLVDRFWVREDLTQGERIRLFSVDVMEAGSSGWTNVNNGTAVGNKRIVVLPQPVKVSAFRLNVHASIAEPYVADFAVFSPCPAA